MKITIVLAGTFLLVFSESLLACHGTPHSTTQYAQKEVERKKGTNGFAISSALSSASITGWVLSWTEMTGTSFDCHFQILSIQQFFNDKYQQIAEESAQGSGQHLEALASLTGCSVEQYGTFETAMNRNHRYVFADKDYDGSINNFFTVLNTDKDLKQCFGHS